MDAEAAGQKDVRSFVRVWKRYVEADCADCLLPENPGSRKFLCEFVQVSQSGGNSIFPLDKSQMSAIIRSQSIITQMRHSPFGSVLSSSSLQSEKMVRLTDKGRDRRRFLQEVYANFDSNLL